MTYEVLLTRKANKFIARVRQWPVIVVEGESEEEVLRQAQGDLKALLARGRIIQLGLDAKPDEHPWQPWASACLPVIPIGTRFKCPCNSTGRKLIGQALRSRRMVASECAFTTPRTCRLTPWPPPKTVCRALPHPEQPHLCVRMTAQQPFGRGIIIAVDLIRSCLNVDRHELAIVPRSKVRTDITRIDGLSPLGKLCCAVAWFQHGHGLPPRRSRALRSSRAPV